jgi:hypothetical protein
MPSDSKSKEGVVVLAHVTAFFAVSFTLLLVGGAAQAVTIMLLLLTLMLFGLFTRLVFIDSRRVGVLALIATWALVLGCVVINYANLYFADDQADPKSFTAPLSRVQALELSLGTLAPEGAATATPKSEGTSVEHALEVVFAVAALGLPASGLAVALQQGRSP